MEPLQKDAERIAKVLKGTRETLETVLKDLLPPPPWEGPPIPRMLSHKRGNPFWHPRFRQVGPTEESPPEAWAIWEKTLKAARGRYPIGDPLVVAEAESAGLTQEQLQALIAHEDYMRELNVLTEIWRREYERHPDPLDDPEPDPLDDP